MNYLEDTLKEVKLAIAYWESINGYKCSPTFKKEVTDLLIRKKIKDPKYKYEEDLDTFSPHKVTCNDIWELRDNLIKDRFIIKVVTEEIPEEKIILEIKDAKAMGFPIIE